MATIHRRTSEHQPADVLAADSTTEIYTALRPDEANQLVAAYGGWHGPWVTS